mgnify:CR=1 FL=1
MTTLLPRHPPGAGGPADLPAGPGHPGRQGQRRANHPPPALPEVHRLLRHLPLTPDHHYRQTQEDHLPVLRLPGPPLQETTRLHLPRHPDRDRRGRGRTPLPAHPPAVHPARGAGTGTPPPTSPHDPGHPAAADPDHRHPAEARAPAAQTPPGPLRERHPRGVTTQGTTTHHSQPNRR